MCVSFFFKVAAVDVGEVHVCVCVFFFFYISIHQMPTERPLGTE